MNQPTRRDDILYAGLLSALFGLVLVTIVAGYVPAAEAAVHNGPAVATVAPAPGV